MKGKNILFRFLMTVTVLGLFGLSSAQAQTTPTSFSGDATGVIANANVLGTVTTNVRVAQTGALPAAGGSLQGDVANANIQLGALGTLSSLTTGIIQTRTSGGAAGGTPNSSQSRATVNNLNLTLLGGTLNTINVTATTVQSTTLCSCGANGPTCSGITTIENLRVNNVLVTATAIVMPAPNTVIAVALLDALGVRIGTITLTLNEQTSSGPGDITVNALRIQVTALNGTVTTNIIVAQSHSDITCGTVTTGCTPTTTVTEGDLFPGGISTFTVTSGPGTVTVDSINAGTGLRSFTVVSATNATVNIPPFTPGTFSPVTATYSIIDPSLPIDFTLRAASQFHAVFIRVRCSSTLNTFSGRATAVNATILGVNATLVDTGELPAAGGSITAIPLLSANVLNGALTTGLLNANTQGAGDQSRSQATVETLNSLVGGNIIMADLVASSSQCTCTTGGPICEGSIQIANLRINGVQIAIIDQAVNQTVNLPGGGMVIINQQIRTGSGNTAGITNNGLRVIIPGIADEIIASAHSDIICATQ